METRGHPPVVPGPPFGEPEQRLSVALADRYRIERQLGVGGMATVYLAEDLKHRRRVAVKVLKPELAAVLGAERFVQEIATTAALQHPNILPLFDSGTADGFLYYVMPFIDGETLRSKLDRETQLAIAEAVRITRDVADALEYAHGVGVIHRDIKPENILLANGRPMVADFGIALAVSAAAGGRMTETGLSLGTPHYMSPEQATAEKEITARSDIYSLGSVLYEMLTGSPPHTGASAQQIIMKIVTEEPAPVTKSRRSVPPNVAAAVATSLEKLPADRFAHAKDFAQALDNPAFTAMGGSGVGGGQTRAGVRHLGAFSGLAAVAVLVVVAALTLRQWNAARRVSDRSAMHLRLAFPPEDRVTLANYDGFSNGYRPSRTAFVFAPDGQSIVFVGERDGVRQLFSRPLAGETASPIPGTAGGESPFFSPDGKSLGFWAGGKLRRVPVAGGPATDIGTIPRIVGASWGDNDRIAAGVDEIGLLVVPASGGTSVDTMAGRGAVLPQWLPGSKAILFTLIVYSGYELSDRRLEIIALDDRTRRILVSDAADGRITSTGQLVFARRGTLMAMPFDSRTMETRGASVVVLADVAQALNGTNQGVRTGAAHFAISPLGDLAYLAGGIAPDQRGGVYSLDRTGAATHLAELGERWFLAVRFSPDGKRAAVTTRGTRPSLHVFDFGRRSALPLGVTVQPNYPMWTPDGSRVIRSGRAGDSLSLIWSPADGTREAEPLVKRAVDGWPAFWSVDGKELFTASVEGLYGVSPSSGAIRHIDNLSNAVRWPTLSPDGKWLAYGISQGGIADVYVQPWPTLDQRWKVSTNGGTSPVWTRNGRELLYLRSGAPDSIGAIRTTVMAVEIGTGPLFAAGAPRELFSAAFSTTGQVRNWDVAADGSRFLVITTSRVRVPPGDIHLVVGWQSTLSPMMDQPAR